MVILALAAVGTGLIIIAEKNQQDLAFRLQQQTAEKVSQLISGYMTRAVDRLTFFWTVRRCHYSLRERKVSPWRIF